MKTTTVTPAAMMTSAYHLSLMAAEANAVIAMRLAGLAGGWSVAPSENERMIAEKPTAFAEAAWDAGITALRGGAPDKVLNSWTRSIRRKTGANARRLTASGPRFF